MNRRPVAIIVGAAGGIGRAIARALMATHAVVATDAKPSKGQRSSVSRMDVTLEREVRAVRDRTLREHGRIDLVVYCAAILRRGPVLLSRVTDWNAMFNVNVSGAARCVRIFGEPMIRQRGGRFILMGSVAARRALPGAAGYAATKAALESLGGTAAVELAPFGVSVVTLSSGWIETSLTRSNRRLFSTIPLRRAGRPSEVAEMVVALANLETDYLTGASIAFDGGVSS
jgi:3-oxoacyl-[acyl-carrier protein] reductase